MAGLVWTHLDVKRISVLFFKSRWRGGGVVGVTHYYSSPPLAQGSKIYILNARKVMRVNKLVHSLAGRLDITLALANFSRLACARISQANHWLSAVVQLELFIRLQ